MTVKANKSTIDTTCPFSEPVRSEEYMDNVTLVHTTQTCIYGHGSLPR